MRLSRAHTDPHTVDLLRLEAAAPAPAAAGAAEVRAALATLWRRRHWIAAATLAALALAIAYLLLVTPRYVATAEILIDPRAKRLVDGSVVPVGFGTSSSGADTQLIDSQIELLASRSVLQRVVVGEALVGDPEFQTNTGPGLRLKLRNLIMSGLLGLAPEQAAPSDPAEATLQRVRERHMLVRKSGNTYVVNVSGASSSATKAARIANAIADAYIADQSGSALDTTRAATALLKGRTDELRKRVEEAETAIERYRAEAGLIATPGGLVSDSQLQQVNDRVVQARSATSLARARYEQLRTLTPQSAALGAQTDALRSPVIASLRSNLARLERREAVVAETLRPGHPDYIALKAERRRALSLVAEELDRIKANARTELDLAVASERALESEMKSLEARSLTSSQAQVRLRELQREAQAARSVYEAFLKRAVESREQESIGGDSTRIITRATPPFSPASPQVLPVLALSLMAGLGLGSLAAWLVPGATPQPLAGGTPGPGQGPRGGLPTPPPATPPPASPTTLPGRISARPIARIPLLTPIPGGHALSRRPPTLLKPVSLADHMAAVDLSAPAGSERYRSAVDGLLRHALRRAGGRTPTVVAVTAPAPGNGASSLALALAYRSALRGQRTLLVDAATESAELSHIFATDVRSLPDQSLERSDHLQDLIARDARTELAILPLALGDLAGIGDERSERIIGAVDSVGAGYDLVVADIGPPELSVVTMALAGLADATLIACRHGREASAEMQRLIPVLAGLAPSARIVLTMAPAETPAGGGHGKTTRTAVAGA